MPKIWGQEPLWFFPHKLGDCYVRFADKPDLAVAYEEEFIDITLENTGFQTIKKVFGSWRINKNHSQDIIVAQK